MAICLALISNNVFANQQIMKAVNESTTLGVDSTKQQLLKSTADEFTSTSKYTAETTQCYFSEFLEKNTSYFTRATEESPIDLLTKAKNFFTQQVSGIDGTLFLERNNSQHESEPLIISGDNIPNKITHTHGSDDTSNNTLSCDCVIMGGCTVFIKDTGTLSMGAGSKINIEDNSKLLISGSLYAEPNCIINIGSHDNKSEKGTGGYLIINAKDPIDLTNLTINLWNKDSHLEIHGNDISLSKNSINRVNDKATVHIANTLFIKDFVPAVRPLEDAE